MSSSNPAESLKTFLLTGTAASAAIVFSYRDLVAKNYQQMGKPVPPTYPMPKLELSALYSILGKHPMLIHIFTLKACVIADFGMHQKCVPKNSLKVFFRPIIFVKPT